MSLGSVVFQQKRLVFLATFLITLLGFLSLFAVPKDEDPRLPDWFGTIVVVLPGGDVAKLDEMIAKPLHEKLREIDELKTVEASSRAGVVTLVIQMKDSITDTKVVWDKVRRALDEAKADFPSGTLEPKFHEDTNRLETILYAVSGTDDILSLNKIATQLKKDLLSVPGTSMIILRGDPSLEMRAEYDPQKISRLSIPQVQIAQRVHEANTGMPAGYVEIDGKRIQILSPSRLYEQQQLEDVRLLKGSLDPVRLNEIASIQTSPKRMENRSYWNGKPAVFLGIVAQHPIEIVQWGELIREKVAKFKTQNAQSKVAVDEVSFNPDRTRERLKDLGTNLVIGILSVGIILWLWMGWKVGLIVSLFVPIISLIGFFLFSAMGGVLHQMSLAAFVLSLGQFIDNIIVVVEWMSTRIQKGVLPHLAGLEAIEQFKKPMLFATGTNISAFLPMLLSTGDTAAFTFAIPFVSILTMIVAWMIALTVIPIFTGLLFSYFPEKKSTSPANKNSAKDGLSGWNWMTQVVLRPWVFIGVSVMVLVFSALGFLVVRKQFFPSADRNQLTVRLELPEGASVKETDNYTRILMEKVLARNDVASVASFVGEQIPRFYYNVGMDSWGPQTAYLLITTKDRSANKNVIKDVEAMFADQADRIFVLAGQLEQGPPILAPIEFKVFHEDETTLSQSLQELRAELVKDNPGILTKNDLSEPTESYALRLDRDLMERFGFTENQFALTLLSATSGLPVTKFFDDGKARDIRLVGPEIKSLEEFENLPMRSSSYRELKLKDIAQIEKTKGLGVIQRIDGRKVGRILGWPRSSKTASEIIAKMQRVIPEVEKKYGVEVKLGGELEGSGNANMAILTSIPIGMILLIVCLLLQFNSMRKLIIIQFSVPFVIAGVTPGLLAGGAAFGFMSLLGVLALVGIVVNNSILLIESIDHNRDDGMPLNNAVSDALATRTRPILMTAVTTIIGLIPMAFEESSLWPPMAWAMISGLVGSTLITLVFVPALYTLFFRRGPATPAAGSAISALILVAGLTILLPANEGLAKVYGFDEALITAGSKSSSALAARADSERAEAFSQAHFRGTFFPKIGARVEAKKIYEDLTQTTPFGVSKYGKSDQVIGGIEVSQPIFNPREMLGGIDKQEALVSAARASQDETESQTQRQLSSFLIEFQKSKIVMDSLKRLEASMLGIEKEVRKFVGLGLRGKSDLLNIQIALSENQANQLKARGGISSLRKLIQIYLPDFEDLDPKFSENVKDGPRQTAKNQSLARPRGSVRALDAMIKAQEMEARTLRLGYLPSVDLKFRRNYADQGLLDQESWFEAALVAEWVFEGGTRSALISAQRHEIEKYKHQQIAVKAQIAADEEELQARREELNFRSSAASENFEMAKKARDEDKRNALSGKVILRDWLSAEIQLEEKRRDIETLRLDKIHLEYEERFVWGETVK
ncbi:MAG: efflux RND transporter permease subunit [bacterium]